MFRRLAFEIQVEIAEKFLQQELSFLREQGIRLEAGPGLLQYLVRKGFHPKLGARPMRDTVERLIGEVVAGYLLGDQGTGSCLTVDPQSLSGRRSLE